MFENIGIKVRIHDVQEKSTVFSLQTFDHVEWCLQKSLEIVQELFLNCFMCDVSARYV